MKVIHKGYHLDEEKINCSFLDLEIVKAANYKDARKMLFEHYKDSGLELYTVEPISEITLPIVRNPIYDIVLFEGNPYYRYQVKLIIDERNRITKLKKWEKKLIKNNFKFCYICKNGYYYRENSNGYTDKLYEAGRYSITDAIDSAMKCNELIIIPINIEEHNLLINEMIDNLKKNLL